ncbi:MAG: ribonuclease P protein component [Chlamydiia bacterium]|nr:ribonuclease P protein component [Chlamydiia bacterium]
MSEHFPKSARLRKRPDFARLNRKARRVVGRFVVVDFLGNNKGETRLGVTVTRRFGKAHDRVRFRRIVREAFRRSREQIKEGVDLNVRPRSAGRHASSLDIQNELTQLLS